MSEFKPGDVVVLKSGGPPMTVCREILKEGSLVGYECTWFAQGYPNEPSDWSFPLFSLKLYADPA